MDPTGGLIALGVGLVFGALRYWDQRKQKKEEARKREEKIRGLTRHHLPTAAAVAALTATKVDDLIVTGIGHGLDLYDLVERSLVKQHDTPLERKDYDAIRLELETYHRLRQAAGVVPPVPPPVPEEEPPK